MPDLPPEDEIICNCHQVSEKTIRANIAKRNITEVEQVTKACEAGGGCQTCHMLLELFIDQHQAQLQSSAYKQEDDKLQTAGFFRKLFRRFRPSESAG